MRDTQIVQDAHASSSWHLSVATLRVVAAVVRSGSLTGAARALGYSQSGISRQVTRAEREVGRTLFVRTARRAEPTDAARRLALRAESILGDIESAAREFDGVPASAAGRVRLGAIPTAMAALVPRAVADMRARHPNTGVELSEGVGANLVCRVSGGHLDAAVVAGPSASDSGLISELLVHDPLLVALPLAHPLAGRPSVGPDDLADLTWVTGTTDPYASLLGSWWPEIRIGHVVRDWTAKVGLVAAGQGATIVPGAVRVTTLIRRDRSHDPALDALAETVRDIAALLGNELRLRLRP